MCLLSPLIRTAMVLSIRWRHSRRTRQALLLSTPLARSDKSYRDRRTWHAATLSSFPGLFNSRVLLCRSRRSEEETWSCWVCVAKNFKLIKMISIRKSHHSKTRKRRTAFLNEHFSCCNHMPYFYDLKIFCNTT